VYTNTPLYLQDGDCFSDGEFRATDGAFDGDGRLYTAPTKSLEMIQPKKCLT